MVHVFQGPEGTGLTAMTFVHKKNLLVDLWCIIGAKIGVLFLKMKSYLAPFLVLAFLCSSPEKSVSFSTKLLQSETKNQWL